MSIQILKADVAFAIPIRCSGNCGLRIMSTPIKIEFGRDTRLESIPTTLENTKVGNSFPVGWRRAGDTYFCPACSVVADQQYREAHRHEQPGGRYYGEN